jgi:hypothetical protein
MKFEYIYGKQSQEFDYLYIPKAYMKEKRFKEMSASAKLLYAVLLEKQQDSSKMGWIDDNNHVYIIVNAEKLAIELNWNVEDTMAAIEELKNVGLLEMEEETVFSRIDDRKVYLKRFV